MPRLAHAHARHGQARSGATSTSTSRARSSVRPRGRSSPGCDGRRLAPDRPAGRRNPSQLADRGHQGPARGAARTPPIVNEPRLFRDPATGAVNGLQNAPQTPTHPSGHPVAARLPTTELLPRHHRVLRSYEIAAGACEGNGLLIDISRPGEPEAHRRGRRSALRVLARGDVLATTARRSCSRTSGAAARRALPRDRPAQLGRQLDLRHRPRQARLPQLLQDARRSRPMQENCVSHLPSLVPVPGRNIMVQAWYQGGASLVDFSDSTKPVEIGYFDRGPISPTALVLGGLWSTYWYNGATYGSEIARGFDVWNLTPTEAAVGERDRGGQGGRGRPAQRAASGQAAVGAKLRRGALVRRSAGALG